MAQKGRPSRLSDPEFLKRVAQCFYAGMSRDAMCKELNVSDPDTITRWRRDPRVQAIVAKLNSDRVLQISRKVDSIIEGRLSRADQLDTETLIKIRKEYGGAAVSRTERPDDDTMAEAMEALEEDPEFVDALEEFIRTRTKGRNEESTPTEGSEQTEA